MPLSIETLYSEACQGLRHYSAAVKSIRTITIAQSFVVLGASHYLIKDAQWLLACLISLFGLLLTIILLGLQSNYWSQFDNLLEYLLKLEEAEKPSRGPGPQAFR